MRAVIQRVDEAKVTVGGNVIGAVSKGLLVLIAVGTEDSREDVLFLKRKILNLRIFEDSQGTMNRSLLEVGGELLIVSQFTLYGDCRKGNRPSYSRAAPPSRAHELYQELVRQIESERVSVRTGRFQAMMKVSLVNDGPVTIIVDSKNTY